MNILPKAMYTFNEIHNKLPRQFFKEINENLKFHMKHEITRVAKPS